VCIFRVISSRRIIWGGKHLARNGYRRGVYRVLVWNPEGKRPLGSPRPIWMDNIEMDFQETLCGVEWFDLVQIRGKRLDFVDAVMNI